ncbi:MAG: DUF4139 domain-containing protein [Chloroflexota bacterium]|nr:DUF4139 domain-containing protein [Chloroflexota bacterium]
MGKIRWRYAGLLVLVLSLMLAVTIAGLAQEQTPTAEEEIEVATAAITATLSPSSTVTEGVLVSPTVPLSPTAVTTETEGDEGAQGAVAATEADQEHGVELTVYNQNLGLVKEVRTFGLEEGENVVRYTGVASQIQPTSVHFVSLTDPEGTTVLEQNYMYDLGSTRDLLLKYVEQEISVRTAEGSVYTGTLLSGVDDIMLASEEAIKVVRMSQVQEFTFPALSEGLITKPTLMWLVRASAAGEQDVLITYLTNGISWQADYIATLVADDEALSIIGWATLTNQSGATYEDAKLKLLAGDVHRTAEPRLPSLAVEKEMAEAVSAPTVEERGLFAYHLYQIERPVTVRDRQTKQIELVGAPDVAVDKVHVYEPSPTVRLSSADRAITDPTYGLESDKKVRVLLEFANKEEDGLGIPLPGGVVRVYKEDADGGVEFVGEDTIDHTPEGEDLSLFLGNAFDVVGERTQIAFEQLGERTIEESYRITLRNQREEVVTVRVIEHLFRAQDAEVLSSSEGYEMLDANTMQYTLDVAEEAEKSITYTVRYEW